MKILRNASIRDDERTAAIASADASINSSISWLHEEERLLFIWITAHFNCMLAIVPANCEKKKKRRRRRDIVSKRDRELADKEKKVTATHQRRCG
jgi:hypothetical protein